MRRSKIRTRAGGSCVKARRCGVPWVRRSLYIRAIPEDIASNEIQSEMQVAKFRLMRNEDCVNRQEAGMRYYIADCHFCHKNLLTEMDNRGFESVEQMNEVMIEK